LKISEPPDATGIFDPPWKRADTYIEPMMTRNPRGAMTAAEALALLRRHGVMLEAARGPVPNIVEAIAGERPHGSWWGHPRGRQIFAITRALRDSPDVVVTRLVDGHITYVHRRLWPALVRMAPRLPAASVARLREVHTATGAHRIETLPFPKWVPDEVQRQAARLTFSDAARLLGASVKSTLAEPS
jgi:hypothetical protein